MQVQLDLARVAVVVDPLDQEPESIVLVEGRQRVPQRVELGERLLNLTGCDLAGCQPLPRLPDQRRLVAAIATRSNLSYHCTSLGIDDG